MALPRGMAKNGLATKKKSRGTVTKAAIGAPAPDSTPDENTPPPQTNTPPPSSPPPSSSSGDGKNWVKPKSYDQDFTPEGIPDDDQWHLDYPVAQIQMNAGAKHPIDVVRFWMQNDGARLKSAEPYDPQHGDYGGFSGVGNPRPDGPPGYVGGQRESTASASVEGIRYTPGSYAAGVTNGMTNRDKYVKY